MSMNDLLIECQNKVAQLEAERDKLAAALYEANNKLDDVRDSFCGKNLMISGWHLNGDLEPVDNWFDSNDWEPVPESEKLVDNICSKAVMNFAEVPRGAYLSGCVTAELTVYDVYQSARNHVKDSYGYDTKPWDDDDATTARNSLNELSAKAIRKFVSDANQKIHLRLRDGEWLEYFGNEWLEEAAKDGE